MSEVLPSRRVIIGEHAFQRAAVRMPNAPRDRTQLTNRIFFEIQEAFREGRVAKREPRWLSQHTRAKKKPNKSHGVHRYAWPREESHCYLLMSGREKSSGGSAWFVKTVLGRHTPFDIEAYELEEVI
jgi:hypothetical protein